MSTTTVVRRRAPTKVVSRPSARSTGWIIVTIIAVIIIIILVVVIIVLATRKTNNCTTPPIPTGLSGVPSGNAAFLSWNTVVGATSYNIYRGIASTVTKATAIDAVKGIIPLAGATSITYLYSGIPDNSSSFFIVSANDGTCESATSTPVQISIPDCSVITPGPAAPVISAVGGVKTITVSVTLAPLGAVRFRYLIRKGADPIPPDNALFTYDTTSLSHTFTGLEAATAYRVAVIPFNSCGVLGTMSSVTTVSTT